MDQDDQTLYRAKQQAYRLLAYRGQTSSELRDRLARRGYTAAIIDEVLRQLASDGYLDDSKLALEWARYRVQTKFLGRRRLAWELQRRGVPSAAIEEVLRKVYSEFDEVTLAEQAARKRLRAQKLPRLAHDGRRQARYLLSLGFDANTIAAALAGLYSVDDPYEIITDGDLC